MCSECAAWRFAIFSIVALFSVHCILFVWIVQLFSVHWVCSVAGKAVKARAWQESKWCKKLSATCTPEYIFQIHKYKFISKHTNTQIRQESKNMFSGVYFPNTQIQIQILRWIQIQMCFFQIHKYGVVQKFRATCTAEYIFKYTMMKIGEYSCPIHNTKYRNTVKDE